MLTLHGWISYYLAMNTDIDIKDQQIARLQKEVAELKAVIAHQNELIAQLRHQLFGTSSEKSGRVNPKNNTNTGGKEGSSNSTNSKSSTESKKKAQGWRKRKIASAVSACTAPT